MNVGPWHIVRSIRLPHERPGKDEPSRMEHWLANLGERGFETYYPMISELKPVPLRKLSHAQRSSGSSLMRHRVVPFLPQLVFVRPRPGVGCSSLLDVPGVIGFMCVGSEPARVADVLIERLRARAAANDGAIPGATPAEFIFEVGDQVRVVNGAFASFGGIVEHPPNCPIEHIDAETRLKLTVDLFGRATPVDLAVGDVRKL